MQKVHSFSTRIALSFGALFSVTMLGAVVLWYAGLPWLDVRGARAQQLVEATRNLESLANQKLTTIRAIISQRRGEVMVLSESKILSDLLIQGDDKGLQKNLVQMFERQERAYPGTYQGLRVVDRQNGLVLASSQPDEAGKPFVHAGLAQRAAQPGVTELLEEIIGAHGPALAIVRPIAVLDDEGYPVESAQGILVATLEISAVVEPGIGNERVGYEQPGVTLIRSAKGDALARFPAGQEKPDAFWRSESMARSFEGALELPDGDGSMVLAVYRHIQLNHAQGWTLIHYQPEMQALAGLKTRLQTVILGGLFITTAALVLILWSARRLTSPLRRLADTARHFGEGDLSSRAVTAQDDSREFLHLAQAFNGMASSVAHNQQNLEAMVAQRTHWLSVQEESLRQSEENLSITLNSIGDAVIATDSAGLITRMNPTAERLTGWRLVDAIGQKLPTVFRIVSAQTRLPVVNPVERVMHQGHVVGLSNHTTLLARDDREYQIADSAAPIRHTNGAIVGVVLVFSDVTEKHRVEEALHASLQDRSDVLSALDEHAVVATTDTEGAITFVNDKFCDISQYTREELMGQNHRILSSGHHPKEFYEDMWTTIKAGRAWHGEVKNRAKDGSFYWLDTTIVPVIDHASGQPKLFRAIQAVITDRVKAQQSLQNSLKEKTALLLEVHHRVKNNLQVIASLLRLEMGRSEHEAAKAVLKDMQARVRSMAILHETIYRAGTFAAIDLGGYIEKIATQSFKSMNTTPGSVQLRLELGFVPVSLDQATPCGLLLSELMSNSLKHGFPEGHTGEIYVELSPLAKSGDWRLRVSDTGVGLPLDFAEKREKSLGLQLASSLAVQMGGTLDMGAGPQAVFTVDFKADKPASIVINL
jgi:PAS domain S-box-containing protein